MLCLSLLVVVVDNTIVNVALPTLVRELHASDDASCSGSSTPTPSPWPACCSPSAAWVTGSAATGRLAGGLVVFGIGLGAGRHLRHRRPAHRLPRALMGIGAAAVMPATLSILTNVFTVPAERARAIALWSAVAGLGVAIGPTLGGWLLEHFSWGSIFLVNVPIVVVALVAGRLVVPPSRNPHPGALDPVGAVLSIAGLVALVYAIIEAPSHGWLSAQTARARRPSGHRWPVLGRAGSCAAPIRWSTCASSATPASARPASPSP